MLELPFSSITRSADHHDSEDGKHNEGNHDDAD
jgi:hypothetical protein